MLLEPVIRITSACSACDVHFCVNCVNAHHGEGPTTRQNVTPERRPGPARFNLDANEVFELPAVEAEAYDGGADAGAAFAATDQIILDHTWRSEQGSSKRFFRFS